MDNSLHFGPFYSFAVEIFTAWPYFRIVIFCIALLGILALVTLTLYPARNIYKNKATNTRDILFVFISVMMIFICRGLAFYSDIANPDEGMILTAALNTYGDPRLWVVADSTTIGPITYLIINALRYCGELFGGDGDCSFALARFAGAILLSGSFLLLYRSLQIHLSNTISRSVMIFYVFFYSFYFSFDMKAYNSEFPYIFFCSLGIYGIFLLTSQISFFKIILIGISLGTMPYCKLQCLPMMAVCIMWCCYTLYSKWKESLLRNRKKLALYYLILASAVLLPTVLIVAHCLTYEHGFSNAYFYYIKNSMDHIQPLLNTSITDTLSLLGSFINTANMGKIFILPCLGVFVLIAFPASFTIEWGLSVLLMCSALFATLRPGVYFAHYLHFLVPPFIIFFALSLKIAMNSTTRRMTWLKLKLPAFILLVCAFVFFDSPKYFSRQVKYVIRGNEIVGLNKNRNDWYLVSQKILDATTMTDHILVWGWSMELHIYTNRKSATAQSNIERIWGGKYNSLNAINYLADIQKNRPKLIIDTVTPFAFGFHDREKYGIESHPLIWPAIKNEYKREEILPVSSNDGSEGNFVIYTRIDRIKK